MQITMLGRSLRSAVGSALAAAGVLAAALATAPEAEARAVIGFGFPAFVGPPIYAPPPPIVYRPPPSYVPPPVFRAAPPVVYLPPPPVRHYRRPVRRHRPCRCYGS